MSTAGREWSADMYKRVAVATGAAGIGAMLFVAVLGPSPAEVPLGRGRSLWPLSLALHPSAWLVTIVSVLAVCCSLVATLAGLAALRRGLTPSPRKLLLACFAVVGLFVVVPPIGSADVLDYASYGHALDNGVDPYRIPPRQQPRNRFSAAVEPPWRGVTMVYGPVALAEQNLAVELSGDRLRDSVAILDLFDGIAFACCAFLVYHIAGNEDRRRRAMVLFGLNPVLLYAVLAGHHVDSFLVLGVLSAASLLRRHPLLAGVAGGLGMLVKLTGALVMAASVLALRRWPRRAIGVAVGAATSVAIGYGIVGLHAFAQVRRAARYASPATPWRVVRSIGVVIGSHGATTLVSVLGPLVALGLIAVLHRNLPDDPVDRDMRWVRVAVAWTLGWTLTAPYVLSWYDALPWAFVALIAASRYDKILLVHTATLAIVYAPGRANEAAPVSHALFDILTVARAGVAPAVLLGLIIVAFRPPKLDPRSARLAAA